MIILGLILSLSLFGCGETGGNGGGDEQFPKTDEQGLLYNLLDDGTLSVSCSDALNMKRISIPTAIFGHAVTVISEDAFNASVYDVSFEEIVIPAGVRSIGKNAFNGNERLSRVYIDDVGSWCSVRFGNVFSNPLCYADVLYVDGEAATSVVIPEGVTGISDYAFSYYSGLTDLVISDSVKSIGNFAFANCTSLVTVYVGSGLERVGNDVFANCNSIREFINNSNLNLTEGLVNIRNTVKFDNKGALMLSHAGLAGIEVANTLQSFNSAGRRTYYGIETDIRRTKDGYYVCFHDATLESKAGINKAIEEMTLEEVRAVRLYERDGSVGRDNLCIPTLEEYVEICMQYEKRCVVELKPRFSEEHVGEIVEIIRDMGYLENTEFISFYFENLQYVRNYAPEAQVACTITDPTEENILKVTGAGFDVLISINIITKDFVDRVHSLGAIVTCYTVDDAEKAAEVIGYGVDRIITNKLEGLN